MHFYTSYKAFFLWISFSVAEGTWWFCRLNIVLFLSLAELKNAIVVKLSFPCSFCDIPVQCHCVFKYVTFCAPALAVLFLPHCGQHQMVVSALVLSEFDELCGVGFSIVIGAPSINIHYESLSRKKVLLIRAQSFAELSASLIEAFCWIEATENV